MRRAPLVTPGTLFAVGLLSAAAGLAAFAAARPAPERPPASGEEAFAREEGRAAGQADEDRAATAAELAAELADLAAPEFEVLIDDDKTSYTWNAIALIPYDAEEDQRRLGAAGSFAAFARYLSADADAFFAAPGAAPGLALRPADELRAAAAAAEGHAWAPFAKLRFGGGSYKGVETIYLPDFVTRLPAGRAARRLYRYVVAAVTAAIRGSGADRLYVHHSLGAAVPLFRALYARRAG